MNAKLGSALAADAFVWVPNLQGLKPKASETGDVGAKAPTHKSEPMKSVNQNYGRALLCPCFDPVVLCELPQEPHIVLEIQLQIVDVIFQLRQTLDAQAKGKP
jgi:hypothetical protein